MAESTYLTGVERTFARNEIIVSKTDTKGRMTYVNDTFLKMSDYSVNDCLGAPHNKIRHPDMPRCIFKLLWETLSKGYHSSRRVMSAYAASIIKPLYEKLKAEEDRHVDRKAGLDASMAMITQILEDANMNYDEFIFSVINGK